jgi:hypothetical protein
MAYIVVLNDGETFTDIGGCVIVDMPDGFDTEDIEKCLYDAEYEGLDIETVLRVYKIVEGTA